MKNVNQKEILCTHWFREFTSELAEYSISVDWCNSPVICSDSFFVVKSQLNRMVLNEAGGIKNTEREILCYLYMTHSLSLSLFASERYVNGKRRVDFVVKPKLSYTGNPL